MPTGPTFEIFSVLAAHTVPFVIVGGHAVNFHGFKRYTEDFDAVWLRSPESEQHLFDALTAVKANYIGRDIDPATGIERLYPVSLPFIRCEHLMMLWTNHGFLDLFDYVPGLPDADVHAFYNDRVEFEGLAYASLDWLIKMKRAAGRSQDLIDLDKLGSIKPTDQ